jgi:hypothetical protein
MHTKCYSEDMKERDHFGIYKRRWEHNIRMNLRETGWEGVNWIHLSQDSNQWWDLVNTVMNLRVP